MPETEEATEVETTETTPEALAELTARAEAAEAQAQKLTETLGDADVAAVLKAKADGQSLRMVVGNEPAEVAPEAAPVLNPIELEGMTNSELVENLLKVVEHSQKAANTELLGKIDTRLGGLENARKADQQKNVTAEATVLLKKYPDLFEHKEELIKLAKTGLNLEQAYMAGRIGRGEGLPTPVADTATEAPTTVLLTHSENDEKPARKGQRGFEVDLGECLDEAMKELGL